MLMDVPMLELIQILILIAESSQHVQNQTGHLFNRADR
jgi:hypothetical protein